MIRNPLYHTRGVYGIVNNINNMVYVGQTLKSFGDRRDSHWALLRGGYHSTAKMQEDWNTYGEENFEFVVLQESDDGDEIDELESKYVKHYMDRGLAYNKTGGGRKGYVGAPVSDEAKRIIGEKNRINMTGRKASEETRMKMSKTRKGRKHTEESKKLLSEKLKGKVRTEEMKEKLRLINEANPPSAKYSIEMIKEMRRLYESGTGCTEIANIYNIPRGTVYGIVTYRRWKHLK